MGTTAVHGYPYPEGSDQPQVHLDLKALADDVDLDTFVVCTSSTRPAHVVGRRIFETDTGRTLISDGSAWRPTPEVSFGSRIIEDSAPTVASRRMIIAGTIVATSNAGGDFTLTYPDGGFPTGIASITGNGGDAATVAVQVNFANTNRVQTTVNVKTAAGAIYAGLCRVNYIAVGF